MRQFSPVLCLILAVGCGGDPVPLAPPAEKLEIAAPRSQEVLRYTVESTTGTLGFDMEAPLEKIRGRVPASALSGEILFDPSDITKTTGLLHVDLRELELLQQVSSDDGATFAEETKSDTQNQHARDWLEIGPDTPEDQLVKNAKIEFSLLEVRDASATDTRPLPADARRVTLTAVGDLLLHQRKATKQVQLEVTIQGPPDAPTGLTVRSLAPLSIDLDEYDVRPRTGFGKLAAKTLQAMSPKVAKAAEVSLEFSAKRAP